jgi:hypothetical protein
VNEGRITCREKRKYRVRGECFVSGSREKKSLGVRLNVHLVSEHVAAERDTAVQGHGGIVSALAALHVGPGA